MNDEDAGLITRKRGPKRGSANEVEAPMWRALLGGFAEELIEEAHSDIEKMRKSK
jgi:hypothetical protein